MTATRPTAGNAQGAAIGHNPGRSMARLTRRLENLSQAWFSAYAMSAAFVAYFCMYAFRKPFAASQFEGQVLWMFGEMVDLKIALVISQVIGYALSKFVSIKFVCEISPQWRGWALVGLVMWAELALLLFGCLEGSGKAVA